MNNPGSMLVRMRRHPSRHRVRSARCARHGGRRAGAVVGTAISVAAWLMPSSDAGAFQVCDRSCAPTDAACLATVAACETKIHAYNLYTGQMGARAAAHMLPAVSRSILGSRYPGANLVAYRFAFADRQPPGNATTDCQTTYFGNSAYVDRVRNAGSNTNWFWLLHELAHVEQCAAGGGREAYANRWWDELEAAVMAQGGRIDFTQTPQQLADQIGSLYQQVHDAMPMERAASAKAGTVLTDLNRCCIDLDGRPILPLRAVSIDDRPDSGSARHILAAQVEHGDPPFKAQWRIRNPGEQSYTAQSERPIDGLELVWTPKKDPAKAQRVESPIETRPNWRYDIEVEIAQRDRDLAPVKLTRTIVLSERVALGKPPATAPGPKLPVPPPQSLPQPALPVPGKPPTPTPTPTPGPTTTMPSVTR